MKRRISKYFVGVLCAGIFTICTIAHYVFNGQEPAAVIWRGGVAFCCYFSLTLVVFFFLDRPWRERTSLRWEAFCQHPMLFSALCLGLCWCLPLVLKYPGAFSPDESYGMMQGLGQSPLRARQPVFHSKLLALFYRIGQSIGSENLGIFLFVTVQTLCLVWAVSYMIRFLVRIRAPRWSVMGALIFFCFSPFVTGYIGSLRKDSWFMTVFLMYTTVLAEFVFRREDFWKSHLRIGLLTVSSVAMALFRNGVGYLLLVCTGLVIWQQLRRKEEKIVVKVLALALATVLPLTAVSAVEAIWKPRPCERSESLSFPLQQTARFVRDYPHLVTEQEQQVIGKLWPYDRIGEAYNPYLADPLKYLFNENITDQELSEYFRVWLAQGLRKPGCYAAATLEQNYFLFCPLYNNYSYVFSDIDADGYVVTPEILRPIQNRYLAFTNALHTLPVLSVVNNMAVYNILFLILLAWGCIRKDRSHLLYFLPIVLFLAGVIAGPCIRGHMRYCFPVIYHIPLLLACLCAPDPKNPRETAESLQ